MEPSKTWKCNYAEIEALGIYNSWAMSIVQTILEPSIIYVPAGKDKQVLSLVCAS